MNTFDTLSKTSPTIMIADDNTSNLQLLNSMLIKNGYRVRMANNGEQVLQSLKLAPVDMLLLDVHMPKKDGIETCKAIKKIKKYRSIPIIFISALTESFNKIQAFQAGAADYLTKPFELDELLVRVKTHLELTTIKNNLEKVIMDRTNELKEREILLRNILNNSPDTIYLQDIANHSITLLNRDDFCGYSKQEFESMKSILITVHEDDFLRVSDHWKSIADGLDKKVSSVEFRLKRKDTTEEWIHSRETVLTRDKQGKPTQLLVTLSIITEFKHIQEQLFQSQKMEVMGLLAGGIAHDFNNILCAIIGYTEMTLEEVPKNGVLYENLSQVMIASKRAKNLVAQILSFSRQSSEIKELMYLKPVIKEVTELLRASFPSSIELKIKLSDDTQPVLANATKIHEIIMNLCTNAGHAMGENGILEIVFEERYITENKIGRVGVLEPGFYSVIIIKDTGCGMSEKVLNHIFEPYFTTKPVGEGTGLGLAVVMGIVQSHNGNIFVESIPGKGTEFQIFLKKAYENVNDQNKEDPETEALSEGNERILYVDDEEQLCTMVKNMLGKMGYTVTVFSDSMSALNYFTCTPYKFDLVITDQTMPKINGIELAKEILHIRNDIPVFLCTGYSTKINKEMVHQAGIRELIMKPLHRKDIAKKIRALFDEELIKRIPNHKS